MPLLFLSVCSDHCGKPLCLSHVSLLLIFKFQSVVQESDIIGVVHVGVAETRTLLNSVTDVRTRVKLYAPPHFMAGAYKQVVHVPLLFLSMCSDHCGKHLCLSGGGTCTTLIPFCVLGSLWQTPLFVRGWYMYHSYSFLCARITVANTSVCQGVEHLPLLFLSVCSDHCGKHLCLSGDGTCTTLIPFCVLGSLWQTPLFVRGWNMCHSYSFLCARITVANTSVCQGLVHVPLLFLSVCSDHCGKHLCLLGGGTCITLIPFCVLGLLWQTPLFVTCITLAHFKVPNVVQESDIIGVAHVPL